MTGRPPQICVEAGELATERVEISNRERTRELYCVIGAQ
jgi:hypothetical protein